MFKATMQAWRRHPIFISAGAGAVLGAAYTLLVEISGFIGGNSSAVLPLLFSNAHGSRAGQTNAVQTAGLLLIEVIGNMIGFALLVAIPVAIVIGVRAIFRRRNA